MLNIYPVEKVAQMRHPPARTPAPLQQMVLLMLPLQQLDVLQLHTGQKSVQGALSSSQFCNENTFPEEVSLNYK